MRNLDGPCMSSNHRISTGSMEKFHVLPFRNVLYRRLHSIEFVSRTTAAAREIRPIEIPSNREETLIVAIGSGCRIASFPMLITACSSEPGNRPWTAANHQPPSSYLQLRSDSRSFDWQCIGRPLNWVINFSRSSIGDRILCGPSDLMADRQPGGTAEALTNHTVKPKRRSSLSLCRSECGIVPKDVSESDIQRDQARFRVVRLMSALPR